MGGWGGGGGGGGEWGGVKPMFKKNVLQGVPKKTGHFLTFLGNLGTFGHSRNPWAL